MFFDGRSVVFLTGVGSNDNVPIAASPSGAQLFGHFGAWDALHIAPEFIQVPVDSLTKPDIPRATDTQTVTPPAQAGGDWWRPASHAPQLGWRSLWLGSLIIGLDIVYHSGSVGAALPSFDLPVASGDDAPDTQLPVAISLPSVPELPLEQSQHVESPAVAQATPPSVSEPLYKAASLVSAAGEGQGPGNSSGSSTSIDLVDARAHQVMTFSPALNSDPTAPPASSQSANAPVALLVVGTAGADLLVGSTGDDVLIGAAGNDVLNGRAGADLMIGGTGDDTFVVDNVHDRVVEQKNEGTDLLLIAPMIASAAPVGVSPSQEERHGPIAPEGASEAPAPQVLESIAAPTPVTTHEDASAAQPLVVFEVADEVENVISLASAAITIIGNESSNVLVGSGSGENLNGAGGDDYIFADLETAIAVAAALPQDTAAVTQTLQTAATALTLLLETPTTATSTAADQDLAKEAEKALNAILSGSGNPEDRLLAASSTLSGGAGNDIIAGGRGDDTLYGGMGHDIFVFRPQFGHDVIADFGSSAGNYDIIFFADDQFKDLRDLTQHMSQVGDDVLILANDSASLLIKNVQKIELATNDHFLFL